MRFDAGYSQIGAALVKRRAAQGDLMIQRRLFLVLSSLLVLTACANAPVVTGGAETVLPLNRAWFEGRKVDYITTDVSDATMAQKLGVNHVPRLADALPGPGRRSVVERVYKFAGGEQISVFQSAPSAPGTAATNDAYSPLWRVVMVRPLRPVGGPELQSEEQVLAAAERGDVTLEVTDIVVNCPITRSAGGQALKGVR